MSQIHARPTPTRLGLRKTRGFTLIELMIVVGIIGIMSTIAIQAYTKNIRRARKTEVIADLSNLALRESAYLGVRGHYASTAASDDRDSLYPPYNKFVVGGGGPETVQWVIDDAGYHMDGMGSSLYFQGGGAEHGFDVLNFMPEGGDSRCGYGVISGLGTNGVAPDGSTASEEPPAAGLGPEVFPSTNPILYSRDWFYAVARCDLDKDGATWDFSISHYDSRVSTGAGGDSTY